MAPSTSHSSRKRTQTGLGSLGDNEERARPSKKVVQCDDAQADFELESLDPRQPETEESAAPRRDSIKALSQRPSGRSGTQLTQRGPTQGQPRDQTTQAAPGPNLGLGAVPGEVVGSGAKESLNRPTYTSRTIQQFLRRSHQGFHYFPGSIWYTAAYIAYVPPDRFREESSMSDAPPKSINGRRTSSNRTRARKRSEVGDLSEVSDVDQ